jgi:hypothetical protein
MVGKKGKGKGKGVNFKAKRPEVDHRSAGSSSHDSDKYIQQSNSRKRIVVGKKTQSIHQRAISKNWKSKNNAKGAKPAEEKTTETREPTNSENLTSEEITNRGDSISLLPGSSSTHSKTSSNAKDISEADTPANKGKEKVEDISVSLEKEVIMFYQLLNKWLTGEVEKSPEEFALLESRLHPTFEKITPLGYTIDKAGFSRRYHEWGSRADEVPPYTMSIRNFRVIGNQDSTEKRNTYLVTFDGAQTQPLKPEAVTKVSVVLTPSKDRHLILHVHMTWDMRFQESSATKLRTLELSLSRERALRLDAESKAETAVDAWAIAKKVAKEAFERAGAFEKMHLGMQKGSVGGYLSSGYDSSSSSSSDDEIDYVTARDITKRRIERQRATSKSAQSPGGSQQYGSNVHVGGTSSLARQIATDIISKLRATVRIPVETALDGIYVVRSNTSSKITAKKYVGADFGTTRQFLSMVPLNRVFECTADGYVSLKHAAVRNEYIIRSSLDSI